MILLHLLEFLQHLWYNNITNRQRWWNGLRHQNQSNHLEVKKMREVCIIIIATICMLMAYSSCSGDPPVEVRPIQTQSQYTYVVQTGDTLSSIADKYGVTVSDLLRENPSITDPDVIHGGEILQIPNNP